ncbi:MAG: hypothetical protein ACREFW_05290 [Rhizomicrobium sp.]
MSERARKFVASWVEEYVRPDGFEDDKRHSESRAEAVACLESAEIEGISKEEIKEEFADLVSYMAARHREMAAQALEPKRS